MWFCGARVGNHLSPLIIVIQRRNKKVTLQLYFLFQWKGFILNEDDCIQFNSNFADTHIFHCNGSLMK